MTTWCSVIGILVSSIAQLYAKSLLGLDGVLLSWSFPEFYVSTTELEVSCSSFLVTYVSSTIWTHGSNSQGAETIIPLNNLLMLWEQSKSRSFQFPQYIGLHQLYQASICALWTPWRPSQVYASFLVIGLSFNFFLYYCLLWMGYSGLLIHFTRVAAPQFFVGLFPICWAFYCDITVSLIYWVPLIWYYR